MLRVHSLKKSYSGFPALDGVSFHIESGEVLGLLGPNGAGKSTTISIVAGLILPDMGKVEGSNGSTLHPLELGVAPQSIALYPELTSRENLCFFGALYGLRGKALSSRVDELLERVELIDRSTARVATLSGGMQRRLNLAAALVHSPKLLLLDEPTAGVDPHSRQAVLDFVRELQADGIAVLYSTHYMEEAERICNRVAIIDHGRILASDTVDRLIDDHGGQTLVRVSNGSEERRIQTDNPRAAVLELLSHSDAQGLRVERPDLEAVFFQLTGRTLRQ